MNIHYPRNPIPAPLHPPRRQGPPGTAWPGRGNPKGSQGWGEPGSLLPQPATLGRLFAPPAITEVIPTCFMPQGGQTPLQHEVPPGHYPRHNPERVKGRCSRREKRVHPAPLNSRVETSPWSNWLADRFPGCLLPPQASGGCWVGGCGSLLT